MPARDTPGPSAPVVTYLQFHLAFTVPALGALWWLRRGSGANAWPIAVLCAIAFAYTTPWDNYLVARGVWSYAEGRVLATVGYVPVEEYAFFVIQTIMTALVFQVLRSRWAGVPGPPASRAVRLPAVVGFGAITAAGVAMVVSGGQWLYLGLILGWAGPVLAFMWAVSGEILWSRRRLIAAAVALPTLYLWVADRAAIGLEVWTITRETRTGVDLLGLPIEEAVFFLVTNLMVANGMALLEPSPASILPALRRAARERSADARDVAAAGLAAA